MEVQEHPNTSTGRKSFLKKCRDYISQKFTSMVKVSDSLNGSDQNLDNNSFESDVQSNNEITDTSFDKSQVNMKQSPLLEDDIEKKKTGKCTGTLKPMSRDISLDSSIMSKQTIIDDDDNKIPFSQNNVENKKEIDNITKQEHESQINERKKEILHLQEKVLRLQEKISKLQQKVSKLQSGNS